MNKARRDYAVYMRHGINELHRLYTQGERANPRRMPERRNAFDMGLATAGFVQGGNPTEDNPSHSNSILSEIVPIALIGGAIYLFGRPLMNAITGAHNVVENPSTLTGGTNPIAAITNAVKNAVNPSTPASPPSTAANAGGGGSLPGCGQNWIPDTQPLPANLTCDPSSWERSDPAGSRGWLHAGCDCSPTGMCWTTIDNIQQAVLRAGGRINNGQSIGEPGLYGDLKAAAIDYAHASGKPVTWACVSPP